jgi:hypothetical protein
MMDEDLDYSDLDEGEIRVLLHKFGTISESHRLAGDRFIAWTTLETYTNSTYSVSLVDKGYFTVVKFQFSTDIQLYFTKKGWKIANLLNSFSNL